MSYELLSFPLLEVFDLTTIIKIWFRDIFQKCSLFHFKSNLDKALFLFLFIYSSDDDSVNGSFIKT